MVVDMRRRVTTRKTLKNNILGSVSIKKTKDG